MELDSSVFTAASVRHLGLQPAVRLDQVMAKFSLVPVGWALGAWIGDLETRAGFAEGGGGASTRCFNLEREHKATLRRWKTRLQRAVCCALSSRVATPPPLPWWRSEQGHAG